VQMALPPGSVFKVVTAAALLEAGSLRPGEPLHCRGYLRTPDRLRCAVYKRHGVGHGEVALSDALCESCNVYFFTHAGRVGLDAIFDWAGRFGLGRPTGIDLPGEVGGRLPLPRPVPEGEIDRRAELPAVGQGSVTATPIQIACMMAAVANGGRLVRPHVVQSSGREGTKGTSQPIKNFSPAMLSAIGEGLRRAVADPQGTAYDASAPAAVSWAGKTGTAETGLDGREHAWFAGYAPADRPVVAFVVVLEHAGNARDTAVPVAQRLVSRMGELQSLQARSD